MIDKIHSRVTFLTVIVTLFTLPYVASAFEFQPLSGSLPIIGNNWVGMRELLNALLGMSVGLAAILAVVMLAIGGFKYMTSESIPNVGNAKEQITNAIVGLLIVLAAVLVLWTINPQLTSMSAFDAFETSNP